MQLTSPPPRGEQGGPTQVRVNPIRPAAPAQRPARLQPSLVVAACAFVLPTHQLPQPAPTQDKRVVKGGAKLVLGTELDNSFVQGVPRHGGTNCTPVGARLTQGRLRSRHTYLPLK